MQPWSFDDDHRWTVFDQRWDTAMGWRPKRLRFVDWSRRDRAILEWRMENVVAWFVSWAVACLGQPERSHEWFRVEALIQDSFLNDFVWRKFTGFEISVCFISVFFFNL